MANPRLITAIDVGTTKVCVIVGVKDGSADPEVLAYSTVPCEGLKKGIVSDGEATARAIRVAVADVQNQAGVEIKSAYVGVTGAHIRFANRVDTMDWVGQKGVISTEDMELVPLKVAQAAESPGRTIIHALSTSYTLDGNAGIISPLGMHTNSIDVTTHVISGAKGLVDMLVDSVRQAEIEVDGLVLEPLASGRAVLHPCERQGVVTLVDIGGGTTDLVVFHDGLPHYTSAIAVGGFQFTNDIALIYDTAYSTAESVKLNYAHTDPGGTSAHEEITLQVLGPARERKVHLHDICQLTRERAMELAEIIKMKLKDAGVRNTFDSRIVLTGGASVMPGLLDLMHRMVSPNIRIGTPNDNVVMPDGLRAPSFSTSAGILLWAADQVESGPLKAAHSNGAHRSGAHSNGAHSNGAHSNGATHTNHNGNGKANSTGGKSGAGSIFARPFRALRN